MQNLKVEKDINTPQKMQQQKQRLVRKLQKDFQKWCKTKPIPNDAEKHQKQKEMQEWLTALDKAYQIYPTINVHQIYEYLPLNKEGRLAQNQRYISVWNSHIQYPFPYPNWKYESLQILLIVYSNQPVEDVYLTIGYHNADRIPALDANGNPQKIPPKRTTYLKQEDVHPGYIYEEKKGTKLLYLGNLDIYQRTHTINGTPSWLDTRNLGGHTYVRLTEDVQELLETTTDMADFLQKLSDLCTQKNQSLFFRLRQSEPKKFVRQVSQPLPNIPAKFTIHYEHIETHYEDKPLDATDYEITIRNTQ